MKTKERLAIGELAEIAGVNQQTIRYYESLGLLPEPERTESGYRQYDHSYLEHINFIKNAQTLGFNLEQIKDLVELSTSQKAIGQDVKEVVQKKITELDSKISELESLKQYLESLNQSCTGEMSTSCCPIVESIRTKSVCASS